MIEAKKISRKNDRFQHKPFHTCDFGIFKKAYKVSKKNMTEMVSIPLMETAARMPKKAKEAMMVGNIFLRVSTVNRLIVRKKAQAAALKPLL